MKTTTGLATAVALATLMVAGCGSSDPSASGTSSQTEGTTTEAEAPDQPDAPTTDELLAIQTELVEAGFNAEFLPAKKAQGPCCGIPDAAAVLKVSGNGVPEGYAYQYATHEEALKAERGLFSEGPQAEVPEEVVDEFFWFVLGDSSESSLQTLLAVADRATGSGGQASEQDDAPPSEPSGEFEPLEFSGEGETNIGTIEVPGDATLEWTNTGCSQFGCYFHLVDDRYDLQVISESEAGTSTVSAGTYSDVRVSGDTWTVQIQPGS